MLDVRKPITYLFFLVGALLFIYGLVDPQITTLELIREKPETLTLNLNVPCGASMFLFACFMFTLIKLDERKAKLEKPDKELGAE